MTTTTTLLMAAAGALALTTAEAPQAGTEQDLLQVLPPPVRNSDYGQASEAKVELGKFLFFDKILSGNKNISSVS